MIRTTAALVDRAGQRDQEMLSADREPCDDGPIMLPSGQSRTSSGSLLSHDAIAA